MTTMSRESDSEPTGLENEENGLLMPVGDETALIKAMQYFVENEHKLAGMSEEARRTVTEKFGINSVAKQHQAFFDMLKHQEPQKQGNFWDRSIVLNKLIILNMALLPVLSPS